MSADLEARIRRAAPATSVARDRIETTRTAVVEHAAYRWQQAAPTATRRRGRLVLVAVALGLVIAGAIAAIALRHPPPPAPPAKTPHPGRAGFTLAPDPLMSTADWARVTNAKLDGQFVRTLAHPGGLAECIRNLQTEDRPQLLPAPVPVPEQFRSATYSRHGLSNQPATRNEFVLWFNDPAAASGKLAALKSDLTSCHRRAGDKLTASDLTVGPAHIGPSQASFAMDVTRLGQPATRSQVAVARDGNVVVIVESPHGLLDRPAHILDLALLRAIPRERLDWCEVTSPPAAICADVAPAPAYHFDGLPAYGAATSAPATGQLVASFTRDGVLDWRLYADGRMIWQTWNRSGPPDYSLGWFGSAGTPANIPTGADVADTGYVAQRLTPEGVELIRSKLLATGLFTSSREVNAGTRFGGDDVSAAVRDGNRLVKFDATPGTVADTTDPAEAPAYARALAQVEQVFAGLKGWLPASAWADARIRAFVPSYYTANIERTSPVVTYLPMAQLPPRPRELLQALASGACDGIALTSDEMRELLEAFAAAGITPSDSSPLGFGFLLSGGRVPSGDFVPSYLHFSLALPDDVSGTSGTNGQNSDPTQCG